MVAYKSVEETNRTASPPIMISGGDWHGRVRQFRFEFVVPAATLLVDDTIDLITLPPRVRILGGHVAFEAMTTAGGTAKLQIGIVGTAGKYLGSVSVDAAGVSDWADTIALFYGEKLTAETLIQAVNPNDTSEAWAATKIIRGHLLVVSD